MHWFLVLGAWFKLTKEDRGCDWLLLWQFPTFYFNRGPLNDQLLSRKNGHTLIAIWPVSVEPVDLWSVFDLPDSSPHPNHPWTLISALKLTLTLTLTFPVTDSNYSYSPFYLKFLLILHVTPTSTLTHPHLNLIPCLSSHETGYSALNTNLSATNDIGATVQKLGLNTYVGANAGPNNRQYFFFPQWNLVLWIWTISHLCNVKQTT